jgi:hypothetical protein
MEVGNVTGLRYTLSDRLRNATKSIMNKNVSPNIPYGNQISLGDVVQKGLEFAPGTGDVIAGEQAVKDYQQGDYGSAAFNALTTLPAVGDFATMAKGMSGMAGGLMTAFHGTPHRFPATKDNPLGEFDLSKIGTGEGAQAYGHGIYLAENPEVAGEYQRALAPRADVMVGNKELTDAYPDMQVLPRSFMRGAIDKADGNLSKARGLLERRMIDVSPEMVGADRKVGFYREAMDAIDSLKQSDVKVTRDPGSLYDVDLPDEHIAKMLDWDTPLREQNIFPSDFEGMVAAHKSGSPVTVDERRASLLNSHKDQTGQQFYHDLLSRSGGDQAQASAMLKDLGIPGLKYYDGSSRAAGEGTRNYVVFDPSITKILDRK